MATVVTKPTIPWTHYEFKDLFDAQERTIIEEILYFFPVCTKKQDRVRVGFGENYYYDGQQELVLRNYFPWIRKLLSDMLKFKIEQSLNEFPELSCLMDKQIFVEYQSLGPYFEWKIHEDNEDKFFSLVYYHNPKKSRGTRLYDKDKNFVKEVEWKQNFGMGFFNEPHHFHDFYTKSEPRFTLNFIFVNYEPE